MMGEISKILAVDHQFGQYFVKKLVKTAQPRLEYCQRYIIFKKICVYLQEKTKTHY